MTNQSPFLSHIGNTHNYIAGIKHLICFILASESLLCISVVPTKCTDVFQVCH